MKIFRRYWAIHICGWASHLPVPYRCPTIVFHCLQKNESSVLVRLFSYLSPFFSFPWKLGPWRVLQLCHLLHPSLTCQKQHPQLTRKHHACLPCIFLSPRGMAQLIFYTQPPGDCAGSTFCIDIWFFLPQPQNASWLPASLQDKPSLSQESFVGSDVNKWIHHHSQFCFEQLKTIHRQHNF